MTRCIIDIGSVNSSMHAQDLLLKQGIKTTVVKNQNAVGGCSYGLNVPCSKVKHAQNILSAEHIRFSLR